MISPWTIVIIIAGTAMVRGGSYPVAILGAVLLGVAFAVERKVKE